MPGESTSSVKVIRAFLPHRLRRGDEVPEGMSQRKRDDGEDAHAGRPLLLRSGCLRGWPASRECAGDGWHNDLAPQPKTYCDILRRNPDASLELTDYLATCLRHAQETVKALALDGAEQRLAAVLVEFGTRASMTAADGLRLTVRLTRQDLASMTGLSVETVIRILGRFKRSRLVSGPAKRFMIHDMAQLKAIAAPFPGAESPIPTSTLTR